MSRTRLVRMLASLVVVTFAASACPKTGPRAVAIGQDVRPFIKNARLTRTVLFDSGALRLDVDKTAPKMPEEEAVKLWASQGAGGGVEPSAHMYVFRAAATVKSSTTKVPDSVLTGAVPTFNRRPAWVFIWDTAGLARECGAGAIPTPTGGPMNPSQNIDLIATDGSREGVSYSTRGVDGCGREVGPASGAALAAYVESVPWTIVSEDRRGVVIEATVPPCGLVSSTVITHPAGAFTVEVDAIIPLTRNSCAGIHRERQRIDGAKKDSTFHAPTGLLVGRAGTYFDGKEHRIS